MTEVIKEAKTVEQAIEEAIKELNCSEDDVVITVLQQPTKGIFGISKMARVKVKYINANIKEGYGKTNQSKSSDEKIDDSQLEREAKRNLSKLLNLMGFKTASIRTKRENENIYLDIHSDSEGLLIGKHGLTIGALQYLMNRIMKDEERKEIHFVVDVASYRVRHKNILEKMAQKTANRVIETGQEEAMQAMSAFDRRIVHMILKDHPNISTYSKGEKNDRYVVVAPKSEDSENN